MTVHRLGDLSWAEVAAAASDAIAVLPIGSQEQHAAHLPLGTDTLLVDAVLDEALAHFDDAERPRLVRLPTMPYGHSPHHLFRAAVSLRAETLLAVLRDYLDSVHTSGFTRVLLVNGHGGNSELLALAIKQFALRAPVTAATCNYWDLTPATPDTPTPRAENPETTPGHAGRFETSLMLAARPELVGALGSGSAPPETPLFDRPPHPGLTLAPAGEWERVGGLTDDPSSADASDGRVLLERRARGLAQAIEAFDRATTSRTGAP